jgi:hypothetical protein
MTSYRESNIVPEGLAKTIAELTEKINDLRKKEKNIDRESVVANYKKECDNIKKTNDEASKKLSSLEMEKKTVLGAIHYVLDEKRRRAELRRVKPDEKIPENLRTRQEYIDACIATEQAKIRTIPPEPSAELRKEEAEQKKIRQELNALCDRQFQAKDLLEKDQWRPAYERYAANYRLEYDSDDEDDIFEKCNEHRVRVLLHEMLEDHDDENCMSCPACIPKNYWFERTWMGYIACDYLPRHDRYCN